MPKWTKRIAVLIPFFLTLSAAAAEAVVHDGDTLTLDGTIYRLDGIDAPELDQNCLDEKGATILCGIIARDRLIEAMPGSFTEGLFLRRSHYDMVGNVWEWVEDCYHDAYGKIDAPTDGSAWTSGDCSRRVARGGSWSETRFSVRSAIRTGYRSENQAFNLGLRVARTLLTP